MESTTLETINPPITTTETLTEELATTSATYSSRTTLATTTLLSNNEVDTTIGDNNIVVVDYPGNLAGPGVPEEKVTLKTLLPDASSEKPDADIATSELPRPEFTTKELQQTQKKFEHSKIRSTTTDLPYTATSSTNTRRVSTVIQKSREQMATTPRVLYTSDPIITKSLEEYETTQIPTTDEFAVNASAKAKSSIDKALDIINKEKDKIEKTINKIKHETTIGASVPTSTAQVHYEVDQITTTSGSSNTETSTLSLKQDGFNTKEALTTSSTPLEVNEIIVLGVI